MEHLEKKSAERQNDSKFGRIGILFFAIVLLMVSSSRSMALVGVTNPTTVTCTANSSSQITISWSGAINATYYYYQVDQSPTFSGSWGSGTGYVVNSYTTAPSATAVISSGISAGQTYYAHISSVNSSWVWTSPTANSSGATTPSSCVTPGTPTSLSITPTGATTANISWAAGSPAGSPTLTYYWVVGTSSAVTYGGGAAQSSTSGTTASVTGLTANTTYYLRVYAYTNCNSTSSSYATSSSFITYPSNPTSVAASLSNVCSGVSSSLTAAGAQGTVYWYTGSCGGTFVSTGNPITVTPSSTTTYYALNYNGNYSSGCGSATVTVGAISTPTSVTATPSTISDGSSTNLKATSDGNTINWYNASTGGSLLGNSNSAANYSVSPSTTTTYYAETQTPALSTSLTLGTGSMYGATSVFFNISPVSTAAIINGFYFQSNTGGGIKNISVYYRTGTYSGHETASSDWTLYGNFNSNGNSYDFVPITEMTIPSGNTYGFCLYNNQSAFIVQNGNSTISDSKISVVSGGENSGFFATLYSGYTLYGGVSYVSGAGQKSCSRIPVTVTVNYNPISYSVTGGGTYCTGGSGFAVGLASSQSGVDYQLYRDGNIIGTPISGTGSAISFGVQSVSGNYTVVGTNVATSNISTMTGSVDVFEAPIPNGLASSSVVICDGASVDLYLNSDVSGTEFTWTSDVTSGGVIGNSNCSYGCGTVIVDLLTNTSNVHGDVTYVVTPTSPEGCVGSTFTSVVTVGAMPASPGVITGPSAVCGLNTAVYSIASVTEATSYVWTVPSPMIITSGAGTNTIHVTVPGGTLLGDLTVRAHNNCGNSVGMSTLTITKKPAVPGVISGPISLCGATTAAYSVAPVFGAAATNGYAWTLPSGITIASGSGTNSITVNVATTFVTGVIKVAAVNACGSIPGGTSLTVYGKAPAASSSISGLTKICGVSTITYTATGIVGATNYLWTLPVGLSQLSAAGNSITVLNNGFISGSIVVQGNNTCGTGPSKSLVLSASANSPGVISGPTLTCGLTSASYSIAPVVGAIENAYVWTLPTGAYVSSGQGTNSIIATFANPMVGNVTVKAFNGCVYSAVRNLAVGKVPPTPGVITGPSVVCALGTFNYTIAAVAGASNYLWTLPAGMSVVNGQGTTNLVLNVNTKPSAAVQLKVCAQSACGNSLTQSKLIGACASPDEMNAAEETSFKLYPNPASSTFTISLENEELISNGQQLQVEVYDVLGNRVIETIITKQQSSINIDHLSKGTYIVRLMNGENTIYTKRIVKE